MSFLRSTNRKTRPRPCVRIARVQPAVAEHTRGRLRIIPIIGHGLWPSADDFANSTWARNAILSSKTATSTNVKGRPQEPMRSWCRPQTGDHHRAFRLSISLSEDAPEPSLRPMQQRGSNRRCPVDNTAQAKSAASMHCPPKPWRALSEPKRKASAQVAANAKNSSGSNFDITIDLHAANERGRKNAPDACAMGAACRNVRSNVGNKVNQKGGEFREFSALR